jgi:hypothetical protein
VASGVDNRGQSPVFLKDHTDCTVQIREAETET